MNDRIFELLERAYFEIARAYQAQIDNREYRKIHDRMSNGDKRYVHDGLWGIKDTETGKMYYFNVACLFRMEEAIEACNAFAEAFNNRQDKVQDKG